ncbi:hypothetical protein BZL30_2172 [Mycobacterium kansasii]|uniref:Uncharacterized protein n=1 Tax=Mycobacterium kansasii TaxID=1768 RepID=A0A1V3XHT4_MYCKA|nr:hypothetical protein BZL30_2172 [Mycobacterium kansasii]
MHPAPFGIHRHRYCPAMGTILPRTAKAGSSAVVPQPRRRSAAFSPISTDGA